MFDKPVQIYMYRQDLSLMTEHQDIAPVCYGNTGCGVFKQFWNNGKLSKIGHHFSNKEVQKLILPKNVNKKNVLLNWYSSMKKKLRKIRMIFDVEN